MEFFADDGAYRMTETTELADGRAAVSTRIQTILNNIDRFDVLDTFARGPMVINERLDYFSDFALKTWHGVGVFFIRDGKIVDWYDYTIEMEQA
jgi:limonene-1,2-epoxide hydrolase